jgi:radical SAM superfamily enzyme YgiQ (UPF0313 family)
LSKSHGISALGYFMIGFPEETPDQVRRTIKLARELDPDFAIFHCLVPGPGTEYYRLALKDPRFGDDFWKKFAESPWPHMTTRTWETSIPEKKLFRMSQMAYLRFYFRPRYLLRSLGRIRSTEDFLTKARMALRLLAIIS